MRRARLSLSRNLKGMVPTVTGSYNIEREGVVYSMPLSLMNHLKAYFRQHEYDGKQATVANWYADLSGEDRNMVKRTGHKETDTGFFPDIVPE